MSPFIRSSLRQFDPNGPDMLLIFLVFFEKQSKSFFRTQLGNTGEILYPEPIQNLSSLQFAFAQTERAFDGVGRHW